MQREELALLLDDEVLDLFRQNKVDFRVKLSELAEQGASVKNRGEIALLSSNRLAIWEEIVKRGLIERVKS